MFAKINISCNNAPNNASTIPDTLAVLLKSFIDSVLIHINKKLSSISDPVRNVLPHAHVYGRNSVSRKTTQWSSYIMAQSGEEMQLKINSTIPSSATDDSVADECGHFKIASN